MANYLQRGRTVSIQKGQVEMGEKWVNRTSYAHRTGPIFVAARLTILNGSPGEGREAKMKMANNQAKPLRPAVVLTVRCWNEQEQLARRPGRNGGQAFV